MEALEQLAETEIIRRILHGQTPLYEIIVRRFNACLYKIGRSYNYSHEDTQDLMQETYIAAFKNLSQFQQRASFKTWIIKIMLRNCYHKKQRLRFKNECAKVIQEEQIPMFSHSTNDGRKEMQSRELGHIIEEALVGIPEDYRMVFSLREMNGLNVAETSAVLHISEANVKVRLNRAKRMLRTAIEASYTAGDLFEFDLRYCDPFTQRVMRRINAL